MLARAPNVNIVLPIPPDNYDPQYMHILLQTLTITLNQLMNPGSVRATMAVLSNLPTSAAGLESGSLWRDAAAGNTVRIVP